MDEIEMEIEMPTFNENNSTKSTEHDSLNVVVPLSTIYGIIFISGVLGNIITCTVIKRNRLMHTPTNYYLFGLAISDFLLLICGLPFEIYRLWQPFSYPLKESVCIAIGLVSETSANATVLTIAALTIERYVAINYPFRAHNLFKLSKVVKYIITIWICSLCFALPQVMQFGIVTYEENGRMLSACTVRGQGVYQVFVISSWIFFVVPMCLITVLYIMIGIKMLTSSVLHPVNNPSIENVERSNGTRRNRNGASQIKVIRMLAAVTISFFLCWAPFHAQRLLAIYGKSLAHPTDTFYKVYIFMTYLSGVLYYVSTTINPILYSIMSKKFRNAFKVTLSSWFSRRGRLDSTSSALLAALRERAAARAFQDYRHPRLQRPQFTASSQQRNAPPAQAQCLNRNKLAVIYEQTESELSSTSPQSISNSSLREVDQELSCEELTTYLYHLNNKITGEICDSYV